MSGDGFTFDFGGGDGAGCDVDPPAPVAPEPDAPVALHPLGATPLTELLAANVASMTRLRFQEVALDAAQPGLHDDERRSLMHVLGARVEALQQHPHHRAEDDHDGIYAPTPADDEDDTKGCEAELRDMVPGQYLGGLKVWSCAVDLAVAVYTAGTSPNIPPILPPDAPPTLRLYAAMRSALAGTATRILELGCGHGLPGMAAVACGATDVTFHDFNHEVVERCLLPNLCATFGDNLKKLAVARRPRLVPFAPTAVVRAGSGAWATLAPAEATADGAMDPMLFDAILGADVTYDDEATHEVIKAAARLLRPGGTFFLGTKVYYFGTGGGVAAVEAAVARHPQLSVQLDVPVHTDGDSMPRHILAVTKHA